MAYKVNAKRTEAGAYTLEYGKGKKKLSKRLIKHGRGWKFIEAPPALLGTFGVIDQAKQAFERWAGGEYGGPIEDNPLVDSPVSDKGTILDPTAKYGMPPSAGDPLPDEPPEPRMSGDGKVKEGTDFFGDYDCPDPLDPDNYEKIDGYTHVTAIGALRHVFMWAHSRYADNYPKPFESARRHLARMYPNEMTYQLPTPAKGR